ncbi:MAG: hypothetical protein FWE08_02495 [Oscillospiraceae bacterium]|nr:hypothetical protein [Oscillospiraceae bacterium]
MKKTKLILAAALFLMLCLVAVTCVFAGEDSAPETEDLGYEAEEVAPPEEEDGLTGEEPDALTDEPDSESEENRMGQAVQSVQPPQAPHTPLSAEAEFLSQFVTLFSFSWERNGGALYNLDWVGGEPSWFDRNGNPIGWPSFASDEWFIPVRYHLYDLDNNSVSTIFIHFNSMGSSEGAYVIYRLINGTYQEVGRLPYMGLSLFRDSSGRLVALYHSPYYEHYAYYYLTFSGNVLRKEVIVDTQAYYLAGEGWQQYFFNHITGERTPFEERSPWGSCSAWEAHYAQGSPTIFGMPDERLTPIRPMTELQESINAAVRARLGV